jgi:hypothetical protein
VPEPPVVPEPLHEVGGQGLDFGGHFRGVSVASDLAQERESENTTRAEIRLAHFHIQGSLAETSVGFRLEQDFASQELEQAYFFLPLGEMDLQVGRFRSPFTASNMRDEGTLFFLERSRIGALFGEGRGGVQASGSSHPLDWAIALQGGGDGVGQDLLTVARVTHHFLAPSNEVDAPGARYSGASGSISASGFKDTSTEGSDGLALDLRLDGATYSLGVEVLFLGGYVYTGNGYATEWLGTRRLASFSPRSVPWAVQGAILIFPSWEAGLRIQDSDNDARETRIDVALSRRSLLGPLRWTGQYSRLRSDTRGDAGILQLGLGMGF